MNDHEDLIRRLEAHGAVFNRDNVALDAATAIKELVDRAEKAEADLAAARAALKWASSFAPFWGMGRGHAPAIAAARAEKGGE